MRVVINETGVYSIDYSDAYSAGACQLGISVNSTQLTTSLASITATDRKVITIANTAQPNCVTVVLKLQATDVVRAHTDGNPDLGTAVCRFSLRKISG